MPQKPNSAVKQLAKAKSMVSSLFSLWIPHQVAVKLETISGNVTGAKLHSALDLHSISGCISMSLPEAVAAGLRLKSVTAALYPKLYMKIMNEKEEFPIVGYEMQGRPKGGAPR